MSDCCGKSKSCNSKCVNKAVFTMTNGKNVPNLNNPLVPPPMNPVVNDFWVPFPIPDDNKVIMYGVCDCGKLEKVDKEKTGGYGTGPGTTFFHDPLGSQDALISSEDGKFLFAVNAGILGADVDPFLVENGTVSSFRICQNGLKRVDVVDSLGVFPISLTIKGDLLYVLNGGAETNVVAFRVQEDGKLVEVPGSKVELGVVVEMFLGQPFPFFGHLSGPCQVSFNPDGTKLIVTIKEFFDFSCAADPNCPGPVVENACKGSIYVWDVLPDGTLDNLVITPSAGRLLWSFVFYKDFLVTTEIFGKACIGDNPVALSALSSYRLNPDNTLTIVTETLENFQTSSCWIKRAGKFIYVVNTFGQLEPTGLLQFDAGTGSISLYTIDDNGELTLVNQLEHLTYGTTTDVTILDDKYLYVLSPGSGSIQTLKIKQDGHLKLLETMTPFKPYSGVAGLVAVNF